MLSVGIDTVEIARIEKSLKREGFALRVYGAQEMDYINSHGGNARHFASAFAAKEAFAKSLGTGVCGFELNEVQLVHDDIGAPYLLLSGRAKEIADRQGLVFSVSVTHTNSCASAIVIADKKEGSR
jgi:holo-[acyl-carrier protein] synthase